MFKKSNGRMSERKNPDRINEYIKWSPVRVIDPEGRNLGVIPTDRAKQMAAACQMDLVEIAPNARPPVCRIMDYGKFRFEQGRKDKEEKSKQRQQPDIKGMRFSSTIGENDMETKLARVKEFLLAGHRVKIEMRYRKGALAHKEVGFKLMKSLVERLQDMSTIINPPRMEGKSVQCLLGPVTAKR